MLLVTKIWLRFPNTALSTQTSSNLFVHRCALATACGKCEPAGKLVRIAIHQHVQQKEKHHLTAWLPLVAAAVFHGGSHALLAGACSVIGDWDSLCSCWCMCPHMFPWIGFAPKDLHERVLHQRICMRGPASKDLHEKICIKGSSSEDFHQMVTIQCITSCSDNLCISSCTTSAQGRATEWTDHTNTVKHH